MNTLFCDVSFVHGMNVQYQRKTLETKVACLELPHSGAHAPTGKTSSFDDKENSNSWEPFASLSFIMNEAMSMIIFYEREDPALGVS